MLDTSLGEWAVEACYLPNPPSVPPDASHQGAHEVLCRLLGLGGAARIDTSMWRQRIAEKWDKLEIVRRCGVWGFERSWGT